MPPLDPPKHYDTEDREFQNPSDSSQDAPPPMVASPGVTVADDNQLAQTQANEGDSGSDSEGSSNEEPTKEELYEEAQELDVEGRSSMSKEELAEAVEEANEEPTKEELYEEAQELDVEGRSSMNKDELQEAVEEAQEEPAKKSTSKKK